MSKETKKISDAEVEMWFRKDIAENGHVFVQHINNLVERYLRSGVFLNGVKLHTDVPIIEIRVMSGKRYDDFVMFNPAGKPKRRWEFAQKIDIEKKGWIKRIESQVKSWAMDI